MPEPIFSVIGQTMIDSGNFHDFLQLRATNSVFNQLIANCNLVVNKEIDINTFKNYENRERFTKFVEFVEKETSWSLRSIGIDFKGEPLIHQLGQIDMMTGRMTRREAIDVDFVVFMGVLERHKEILQKSVKRIN